MAVRPAYPDCRCTLLVASIRNNIERTHTQCWSLISKRLYHLNTCVGIMCNKIISIRRLKKIVDCLKPNLKILDLITIAKVENIELGVTKV